MADVRPCPECNVAVETCTCGEWDCALYSHLGHNCPSQRGIEYRRQAVFREVRNAALKGDEEAKKRLFAEFRDLFEEWAAKMKAREA